MDHPVWRVWAIVCAWYKTPARRRRVESVATIWALVYVTLSLITVSTRAHPSSIRRRGDCQARLALQTQPPEFIMPASLNFIKQCALHCLKRRARESTCAATHSSETCYLCELIRRICFAPSFLAPLLFDRLQSLIVLPLAPFAQLN